MERRPSSATLYSHGNNSSSTIQYPQGFPQAPSLSSQVSSVGFSNLKKLNTNSSTSSSVTRSNPLTRLFTKNKLNNSLSQPEEISFSNYNNSDEDETSTLASESKKSIFGRLKKSKLRFPKQQKPDLTIQTNGHHGLKVPKKILSSNLVDDPSGNRKSSTTLPSVTFHNLFHRSHSHSQLTDGQPDEIGNPNRTTVGLSSNNSNSTITDISFAMLYNFTDPDYSIEEPDTAVDHLSFIDIHKKLMVPTDQYIQNRIYKQPTEVGLGIVDDDTPESSSEDLGMSGPEFGKDNARFYTNLLGIVRPLFLPSQQKKLSNGKNHAYLGMTIEDVANYIKDSYFESQVGQSPVDQDRSPNAKANKLKKVSRYHANLSVTTLPLEFSPSYDNFDQLKAREASKDLLAFFLRALIGLRIDFESQNPQKWGSKHQGWSLMSAQWTYFNSRIRYSLVVMFHPLQKYFHDVSIRKYSTGTDAVFSIEIENIMLAAFRDVIVMPHIIRRSKDYLRAEDPSGNLLAEEKALRAEVPLIKNLINCFGVLVSNTRYDQNSEELRIRDRLFTEAFHWLAGLNSQCI